MNNHLASLSGFTTWVHAQAPRVFAPGDPGQVVGFSAYLAGINYSVEQFRRELDEAVAYIKSQQPG